ncbi:MAG: thioredoxin domain-containing protein [Bacteriovoracaceae bacterium]
MDQKSIYRNSSFNIQMALMVLGVSIILVSIYLTSHYFGLHFPSELSNSSSLCNINSYFNCNGTSLSTFSNIFGVPVAIPGAVIGLLVLLGFAIKNEGYEKTLYSILILNAVGCLLLLIYSLFFVGGLCPFCTVYYILSWVTLFLFLKNSASPGIDVKSLAIKGVILAIPFFITLNYVNSKTSKSSKLAQSLMQQFDSYPKLGKPKMDSNFRLDTTGKPFDDAPVRITIFSDFQCPACAALSKVTHKIAQKFPQNVHMQYFFYPLDHNCNSEIKRPFHTQACRAAYLTGCVPSKFGPIHDDVFNNQATLSKKWLDDYAKKEGVEECYNGPEIKNTVVQMIDEAKTFSVKSTPTMLVNGVKIEGVFPPTQMFILIEELIKRAPTK